MTGIVDRRAFISSVGLFVVALSTRAEGATSAVVDGPRNWRFLTATPLDGPRYWETYAASHTVGVADGTLRIEAIPKSHPIPCLVLDSLAPKACAGRRISLSVDIDRSAADHEVRLWLKASTPAETLLHEAIAERNGALRKGLRLEMDVPAQVQGLDFGLLVDGAGSTIARNLEIHIDGGEPHIEDSTSVSETALIDAMRAAGAPVDGVTSVGTLSEGRTVIGLGEATHGSSEVFAAKIAIVQQLVERGFSIIAYEANLPEMDAVNHFVNGGDGNIRNILTSLGTWPVACEEIATLAQWIRDHNVRSEKPVQFIGVDAQSIRTALQRIREIGATTTLAGVKDAIDGYTSIEAAVKDVRYDFIRPAEPHDVLEAARSRAGQLEASLAAIDGIEAGQSRELARMARVIRQTLDALVDERLRDTALADNVLAALDEHGPGARAVFWAHNGHINVADPLAAGSRLRRILGQGYLAIGSSVGSGTCSAVGANGLGDYPLSAGLAGSDIFTLSRAFSEATLLTFSALRKSSDAATWLAQRREHRSIGAIADAWGFRMREIGNNYDALVFVPHSTPTKRLPG